MTDPARTFQTERTRRILSQKLSEEDKRAVSDIETYGCHIIQVSRTAAGPGWSYTFGVYDTCGKPEIITVGLFDKTAHFLLNEAALRLRNGVKLTKGRHCEMVGDVECEFRPVDAKWVKHLMGWALWYYDGDDFPVLQAVYPDRENRFQEEAGFDNVFRQPLLQPNVTTTQMEDDFWKSADPDSSLFSWKFPEPPHTHVYLSKAVHAGTESITYVSHDAEDGGWQFLGDSMVGDGKPVVSCLHHPLDDDPSLSELADLPLGWWAERAKPGDPWFRYQHQENENSTEE